MFMAKIKARTSQDLADTELETQVFQFPVKKRWTQPEKASQGSDWTISGV